MARFSFPALSLSLTLLAAGPAAARPHRIEKEYGARHTITRVERIRLNP